MAEAKNGAASPAQSTGWWSRLKQRHPFLQTKRGHALVGFIMILPLFGLLGLLALRHHGSKESSSSGSGGTNGNGEIVSDVHFYGQSPPVYPSPNMTGSGNWTTAYKKAQAFVANLTLAEMVNLTAGTVSSTGCAGWIPAISRVGFPGLCLNDAPTGVRNTDFVSGWPAGIHVGASWNRNLTQQRGYNMGGEFKTKGVQVALGPVVGPIGRTVRDGRNWEGFASDPYLSGVLAAETVTGIQAAGVQTSTKHYIAYEQETNRMPLGSVSSVSSNVDDKTMHELYLWPFMDALRAGTANIMCSYNRINNSYGCQNSKTLNGLLKTELGFQGFVVSDWGGQHSGVASALAGLDMAMPEADGFWGSDLVEAVNNGTISATRVSDMATRIIAAWYQLGQDSDFPDPGVGMPGSLAWRHTIVDARVNSSKEILLNGAVEGHVLVKNTKNALPLNKPKMLSLFGYSAASPFQWNLGPGFQWGAEANNFGSDALGEMAGEDGVTQIALNGTLYSGGGSGASTPIHVTSPFDALNARAYDDDTALFWDFQSQDPYVDPASEACIVMVNAWSTEGSDRSGIDDTYSDDLILNVASNCNNTIVVMHNAGTRLVDQFADHDNVTAIIFAHLPGQASGQALVKLLYGEENFSGKLPYTVAHKETDYGSLLDPSQPEGIYTNFPQSDFIEGVYIDYRRFDEQSIVPRYEFGYGLSYTTYSYSDLSVTKSSNASTSQYPTGSIVQGGQEDLWDVVATVTATIKNAGGVDGAEAAQLYIGIPNAPAKQLRGFDKPTIQAGESATVSFDLTRRDLSIWNVVAQKWQLQSGTYQIYVGASSRSLPLNGTLTL